MGSSLFLLLLAALGLVISHPPSETPVQRKYCGINLANVLSVVCHGVYNAHEYQKRGQADTPYLEDNKFHYPFRSRSTATALISYRRKRSPGRGVYNECCEKACTIDELKTYCGGSSK